MQTTSQTSPEQLAARILALAADNLDSIPALTHPLTGRPVQSCMTAGHRDHAIRNAQDAVLNTVIRHAAQDTVRALVRTLLPPVTGTVTDYAARLRQTVETLTLAA